MKICVPHQFGILENLIIGTLTKNNFIQAPSFPDVPLYRAESFAKLVEKGAAHKQQVLQAQPELPAALPSVSPVASTETHFWTDLGKGVLLVVLFFLVIFHCYELWGDWYSYQRLLKRRTQLNTTA